MRLEDGRHFFEYFRMSVKRFDGLLALAEPLIRPKRVTSSTISAGEKVAFTLRGLRCRTGGTALGRDSCCQPLLETSDSEVPIGAFSAASAWVALCDSIRVAASSSAAALGLFQASTSLFMP
ncbi:hypothetical protein MRX96_048270 [Rhipicephalus microplus]